MKLKVLITSVLSILFTGMLVYAGSPSADLTINNLKDALTGETTASAKYLAYSKKAKEEGYNKIALLFEAASKAEGIHANNHRAVLEQLNVKVGKIEPKFEVKSTKENLEDAINGESYEVATMYPGFIKTAQEGNVNLALISFNYAYQTEKKHKAMYQNALEKLNSSKENTLSSLYMVCTTCGNTYDGKAPKRCGISMTPRERFLTIE
ncbi:MAG: ferritin family protein [Ignavibacteriaceae bacterium]